MNELDLRQGNREFRVATQVQGPGGNYDRRMGPDVLVTARSVEHAKQIVRDSGREVNPHFEPSEIRKR